MHYNYKSISFNFITFRLYINNIYTLTYKPRERGKGERGEREREERERERERNNKEQLRKIALLQMTLLGNLLISRMCTTFWETLISRYQQKVALLYILRSRSASVIINM